MDKKYGTIFLEKALSGCSFSEMSDGEKEYFSEWIKVDNLVRDRVYSIEHLRTIRTLLENLPSTERKKDSSFIEESVYKELPKLFPE